MTEYILILLVTASGSGGGNVMTSALFPTKAACENASVVAVQELRQPYMTIRGICVPRNVP